MSKSEGAESIHAFSNEIKVGCFIRNRAKDVVDPNTYYIRKNHIVGNQCDEFIDLDKDLLSEALEETRRSSFIRQVIPERIVNGYLEDRAADIAGYEKSGKNRDYLIRRHFREI